ncbi:MAG: hypothetical protein AseanaTS_13310 [Candidatus Pelagadaptatus aseana]|uniref:class I SAM-dependent methyltransferase n=1 Tax=Candidatus Pelagadaptatus aseana TaxID=3120508 RepID=UPI0039B225D6
MTNLTQHSSSSALLLEQATVKAQAREWLQAAQILEQGWPESELGFVYAIQYLECLINAGRLVDAERVLSDTRNLAANDLEGQQVLMAEVILAHRNNDLSSAYVRSHELAEPLRMSDSIRNIVRHCLDRMNCLNYSPMVEKDVLSFWDDELLAGKVHKLGTQLLALKYGGQNEPDIVELASDQLLIKVLEKDYCRSAKLEPVLVAVRRKVFFDALVKMDFPDDYVPLVQAIAWQNKWNEYVHVVESDELQLIAELEGLLKEQVAQQGFKPIVVEGLLLLLAMYKPVRDFDSYETLSSLTEDLWPESLNGMFYTAILEEKKERACLKSLSSVGSIADSISLKVREQYEENPYPRWRQLSVPDGRVDYIMRMEQVLSEEERVAGSGKIKEVLVAGCGTGKHPLMCALQTDVKVTAIDISRRSLAYAQMKADEYSVNNLQLLHMDLMEVGLLGKQFDAIECAGVLHHMENPEAGLEALLEVIRPGGTIRLGLYSETARRGVVAVRNAYINSGMSPDLENIRNVRKALMSEEARPDCRLVTGFGDFYATSPCRDLLFHAQEHRYTIPQIEALLKKYQLDFLGMTLENPNYREKFYSQFGVEGVRNLANWQDFEEKNPDVFANMYQFFVKTSG